MTLNGGRWETMALVTIVLPYPALPHPSPSPLTSAPSKHNSEIAGGLVGGWVGTAWTLPTAKTWSACSPARVHSCWVLFWLLENKHEAHAQSFRFYLVRREIPKNAPHVSLASLIPLGLRAWVEFTRVCPGGSRLASARLGWPSIIWGMWMRDAWPAHGGRGRWTQSVISSIHTHTHDRHPPLSPMPDDPLVSMLILSRRT